MNRRPIRIGISTCPNDTYAFHALMNQRIDAGTLDFQFELLDVQELNERLFAGDFDVAKASFHAALYLADRVSVLDSGSALGFGVGPLLLSSHENQSPGDGIQTTDKQPHIFRVGCPGQHTTATLLYKLFYPGDCDLQQMVFSDIMPRLQSGDLDFGVCIHEGRFTYKEQGLFNVEDLGTRWEKETQCPLPLGGILVRDELDTELQKQVQQAVRNSLIYANSHREETLATMRRYAQEQTDEVLFAHVDTYVNDWTLSLGESGKQSLQKLAELAAEIGLIESGELKIVR